MSDAAMLREVFFLFSRLSSLDGVNELVKINVNVLIISNVKKIKTIVAV